MLHKDFRDQARATSTPTLIPAAELAQATLARPREMFTLSIACGESEGCQKKARRVDDASHWSDDRPKNAGDRLPLWLQMVVITCRYSMEQPRRRDVVPLN
jgi:hypothetical protein